MKVAISCVVTPMVLATMVIGDVPSLNIHKGVIVHLFEWTYPDIALECEEFLAPHGFKGIQIPPPSENLVVDGRPWWERYQPVSYKLTTRSGSEHQLADMLSRCNKAGVRVFADVVFNHMTGSPKVCQGTAGSTCDPQAPSYPAVPYTSQDFHHPECTIHNYNNASEVRNCDLVGLHDLNQSREHVRQKIEEFLNRLVDIGVAGFRVDAAKHMNPEDLKAIYGRLHNLNTAHGFPANTKPLIYQEVIDMGGESIHYQEYTPLGLVTDLRYGKELGRCFQGRNDLKWLNNFGSAWGLIPDDKSVVFIENHDTERGDNADVLNYKKSRSYKMAVAFMLAWGYGLPKILSSYKFSSFEQSPPQDQAGAILSPRPMQGDICTNGWVCQHRWRQIYNMVAFHNIVQGTDVRSWWDNGKNQIAFCRGNRGFIAFNLEDYPLDQKLQSCLPKGVYCDIISGSLVNGQCSGKTVHVDKDGTAQITISKFDSNTPDDGVLAIHSHAKV